VKPDEGGASEDTADRMLTVLSILRGGLNAGWTVLRLSGVKQHLDPAISTNKERVGFAVEAMQLLRNKSQNRREPVRR
jgi:hypothetical protein